MYKLQVPVFCKVYHFFLNIVYITDIYTHMCRLLLFLRRDFYSFQRSWETDKTMSGVTFFGVHDFYILSASLLHCKTSWVCASEYQLYFLTESEHPAHMVFFGKETFQAKWEQQEVTYHASLRSLMIKSKLHSMKYQTEMKLADHSSNLRVPKTVKPEDVIFFLNYCIIYTRLHVTSSLSQIIKNKRIGPHSIRASQTHHLKSYLKSDLDLNDEQEAV